MKVFLFALLTLFLATSAMAQIEPNFDSGKPSVSKKLYANLSMASRQADLDFIAGMKPHHAGALTMSEEYLKDSNSKNPRLKQLAKGIIDNQTFEIGMLKRVKELVEPSLKSDPEWRPIAEIGLAQKQRFVRTPMPSPFAARGEVASTRDVQFAKAMIIHHQGALDMANHYLSLPASQNYYLRRMCVDILADQSQEIKFMNNIIALYPGNPDNVKITPDMVHGMEVMAHMGGHHGHH
jgi:uncharacterized protein (DUF305 family)